MERVKTSPLSEVQLNLLQILDHELEELHQKYSIAELNKFISEIMKPIPVAAKNEDEVNIYIDWLKNNLLDQRKVFTCARQEIIYYLTEHTNGKERKNKLGVDNEWFEDTASNKKKIKRWYRYISHILRADLTYYPDQEKVNKAFNKLQEMVEVMGLEINEVEDGR